MKSDTECDFIFAELAKLLGSVLCYSFKFHNVMGEGTRIMGVMIFLAISLNGRNIYLSITYQKVYEYTVQLYKIEHQKSCSFLNPYYSSSSENF